MSKKDKETGSLPTMEDLSFMDNASATESSNEQESEEASEEDDPTGEVSGEQKRYVKKSKRPVLNEDGTPYTGPVARVFREDGKEQKRKAVNFQGLSSQMLPPITRKKFAIYEIINKGHVDPLTNQPSENVGLILPGSYVVYDPFDTDVLRRHKTLKNVTRFETVVIAGQNVAKEVVEDIEFPDGIKNVAIEKDYAMYILLENHPLNESNRFRNKSMAAAFRRIDINKRAWGEGTMANMDLAFEAERAVVDMRNADEIIGYAHAAGIPTLGRSTDNGDNSIKKDLRIYARKNPKDFFRLSKDTYAAIKVSVLDAIDLGLIEYVVDKRAWEFSTDGEEIGRHLPGEEPNDALIKLFKKKEYREKYEKLQNQLNYWD